MILSTVSQLELLIYNILAGVLTGFLFDIYRSIRGICHNKIVKLIQDILFWILAAIIVFIFLFLTNYAYIGIYCYIYIMIGLLIYLKLLSKCFLGFVIKLNRFLGKFIRIIFNLITYFFENTFHIIFNRKKKYKNNLNKK